MAKLQCCGLKRKEDKLKRAADFLRVISEPNRLHILCILKKGEQCVCGIWQHMNLSQTLVSHHLKIMKDAGLVASRKDGKNIIYSLNREKLDKHKDLLANFI